MIVFIPGSDLVNENEVQVKFGGEKLKVSKSEVLRVIIDDKFQ